MTIKMLEAKPAPVSFYVDPETRARREEATKAAKVRFLATSGLPSSLTAKMADVAARESEPCPTCGVGRGHWCEHR